METMYLKGRVATCDCGASKESSTDLAFFEYRGPDSRKAKIQCKHCGYYDVAHTDKVRERNHGGKICYNFEPHGPFESDRFYCGCRGWN